MVSLSRGIRIASAISQYFLDWSNGTVSFGTNSHYFFILIRASKLRQNAELGAGCQIQDARCRMQDAVHKFSQGW